MNSGAADLLDLSAHNSPTVVRNPVDSDNLAVVNRIDTPQFSCALHVSTNAAATWSETALPFPEGEELPARCYAPDATFDAAGTLYMSFVTLKGHGNVPNALWITSSPDGGRSLTTPVRVSGPRAFQARLVADREVAGRLYLAWLQADATGYLALPSSGNPILFARSDDGGLTWQGPTRVSASARPRVVAPSVALGAAGELYVLYLDLREDALDYHGGHEGRGGPPHRGMWSLVLARSTDGGATWQETEVDDDVVPVHRFVVFLPPSPALAVDERNGQLYVGFHDGRAGDADVWLWTSRDEGATFAGPVRVNDTARPDGTSQYLAKVAVAPGGRVDVLYYDRRADPADVFNEVSLQSSVDGGRTFTASLRLSERPFDSRIGFGSSRAMPELGSRLGLVSADASALAIWADTRSGTESSGKQDLARAVVRVARVSPWRLPLRVGGLAAVALGLAALLARGVSARPRRDVTAPRTPTTSP